MADFTRLPYVGLQRDVNFSAGNLSEEILSQPFQNRNFNLRAGIHLHWALPDALCQGKSVTDPATGRVTTIFAAVPNRWLITRSRLVGSGDRVVTGEWIVESDYLYPDGEGFQSGSINYPVTPDPARKESRPFRFMGRAIPLEQWQPRGKPSDEYLDRLTAVGYGQPAFAAFYPNCHSVFGFHDADVFPAVNFAAGRSNAPKPDLAGLRYDLLGWYADESQDHFGAFVEETLARFRQPELSAEKQAAAFRDALKTSFRWDLVDAGEGDLPSRLLCYSRIEFHPADESPDAKSEVGIAVGNTGTEALSALLAHELDPERADELEDQLAALEYAERLDSLKLDLGAKFQEARHEKGFQAVAGGTLWTVRPETAKNLKADAAAAHQRSQITLPLDLAHQLNTVNLLQQACDQAQAELASLRRQLFSHWYKYMLCVYSPEGSQDDYPDPDRVRSFIEAVDLEPLRQLEQRTGKLFLQRDETSMAVLGARAEAASPASLAAQLAAALERLLRQIDRHNRQEAVAGANVAYRLKANAGPRYWQPREPVVLFHGDVARHAERHGRTHAGELLETRSLQTSRAKSVQDYVLRNLDALRKRLDAYLSPGDPVEKHVPGLTRWRHQPWHPILLAWEAGFRPLAPKRDPDREDRDGYPTDFLTSNYQLLENAVDLARPEGNTASPREVAAETIYRGTTVLTPQAALTLKGKLKAYLKKEIRALHLAEREFRVQKADDDFLEQHFDDLLNVFEREPAGMDPDSVSNHYLRAYRRLADPKFSVLSQSLGGFNEALLMYRQTLQVPVADPLGFPEDRDFTTAVAAALGSSIGSAPVPESDFNPIRAGELELLRLQLIDTFGQVRDVVDVRKRTAADRTFIAGSLRVASAETGKAGIGLPPRLVQPARVSFRWLSADLGEMEMNDHPATSPVCGWLLCNHLDNSLMIYDNEGGALGMIDQTGRWQGTPGSADPIFPLEIENRHLRKLVQYLLARTPKFQRDFISTIDSALRTIDPVNFAQHQARALLMGRPVALVRASVGLELQGLPATHQAWEAFNRELNGGARHSDRFEAVRIPIRIGEYRQFNDGLVGYWLEEGDRLRDETFYSPQSVESPQPLIRTHSGKPLNLYKSLQEDPDTLLMLVDPRGAVHATSGVLPTKSIELPPDQISDALRKIEITFLSTPILSEVEKLHLPLPKEPGYRWSWLERQGNSWREVSTLRVIRRRDFEAAIAGGSLTYDALLQQGWLKRIDAETARVVSRDQFLKEHPDAKGAALPPAIEDWIERAQITGISDRARTFGRQGLREGWLKLSQLDEDADSPEEGETT